MLAFIHMMIHFFVKPASSRCEWRRTGRPPPSPAGWGAGRRRSPGRSLGRFAVESVMYSFTTRNLMWAERLRISEIPYSVKVILVQQETWQERFRILRSHILAVQSSPPVNIHLPSAWRLQSDPISQAAIKTSNQILT